MDQLRFSVKPYEGDEPYFFISYSHRNSDVVLPILQFLSEEGYRFWYDEGINPGNEWPESVARHLENSIACISFLSPAYMESNNCRRELHYALAKNLDYVSVYLEPTHLSPGIEMQISSYLSVFLYKHPKREAFIEKLKKVGFLEKCMGERSGSQERAGRGSSEVLLENNQRVKKEKQKKKRGLFTALALIAACAVLISVFYISKTRIFALQKAVGQDPTDENESVTEVLPSDPGNESAEVSKGENYVDLKSRTTALSASEDYSNYSIGDTFFFGLYEQDSNKENGGEPIEWIVIDKTEDKLLVLSKYCLYPSSYCAASDELSWAGSLLRRQLNTIFLNEAFSLEQQSRIQMTDNTAEGTQEKLFCLSLEQFINLCGVFAQEDLLGTPTARDSFLGAQVFSGRTPWWLSSASIEGDGSFRGLIVWIDKEQENEMTVSDISTTSFVSVRPAMWISVSAS